MHIHKPKAVHGLREFLSEIGVIVVGILIALSLEAGVDWMHWRHEVREARDQLREELRFDEQVYVHRADVAPCVAANLGRLKGVIADLRAGRRVPAAPVDSPENGPIRHEIWNSMSSAQVLVHFPRAELRRYGAFYQNVTDIEYFMDRESRVWRQLHLVEADPSALSRPEINSLWLAVGEAEEMGKLAALMSHRQVEIGRELGIQLPKPDPAWRNECRNTAQSG